MSAVEQMRKLLTTDPIDPGCAETFELIHAYAQVVVDGGDPEQEMPGITAHLESCGPCADDFRALLEAMREAGDVD